MILVYEMMAQYYSAAATQDLQKASFYTARADYFSNLNSANQVTVNGGISYTYSDRANTLIYFDDPGWRTPAGPSIAAAAWVYYSLNDFDPFTDLIS
jgi:hypothetical protein